MHTSVNDDILVDIDKQNKVIVLHGCNCFHVMGAGIARYLRNMYPEVYDADVTQTTRGDKDKLGTFSTALIVPDTFHVLNCYTQFSTANVGNATPVDYDAISSCFEAIIDTYDTEWTIRLPHIGCGLAGGHWPTVEKLVATILSEYNVEVYYI